MERPKLLFVNLRRIEREGLESLLAARRLGYDVVLLGRSLPAFAAPLVSDFCQVDTYDTAKALASARELAGRYDFVGVPSFTEIDVQLVAAIAAELGLPGMTAEAALRARNKYRMKQGLQGCGDVLPGYRRVRTLSELRDAVREIGFPAVVKPTGASGSKGIFELREEGDLEAAIGQLEKITRPQFDAVFRQFGAEFIVEEYLEGDEFSVEGLVAGGEVHVVMVTDKVTSVPYHLELQHTMPSTLPADALAEAKATTVRIVTALGFDNCAFHLEAKWGRRGMKFIEVAARPAGDYIASHLIPLSCGVDYFANVVRVAVGAPLDLEPDRDLHVALRFVLAERPGRFEGLDGIETVCADPGYPYVFFEHPAGTEVTLPPESFGLQRVAAVCARHVDRVGLDALLSTVDGAVSARVTVAESTPA
ncbi:ATP-grasp domain-containing protein [Micromonospora okii]|uniref:ATP-grasp domain-containing protein n=1 Tax=Micromonospora okii TaxID=1182970 RepID=UPI001E5522C6|nr:ATP-grasp domain-containing protein [Micromonospora okii]